MSAGVGSCDGTSGCSFLYLIFKFSGYLYSSTVSSNHYYVRHLKGNSAQGTQWTPWIGLEWLFSDASWRARTVHAVGKKSNPEFEPLSIAAYHCVDSRQQLPPCRFWRPSRAGASFPACCTGVLVSADNCGYDRSGSHNTAVAAAAALPALQVRPLAARPATITVPALIYPAPPTNTDIRPPLQCCQNSWRVLVSPYSLGHFRPVYRKET